MPIPLAHPAAVLPLRRYSRWFNFPALVIGSVVPDFGYLASDPGYGDLSHQFLGSIAFGFPIGIVLLAILYGFRSRVVGLLPESQRQSFLPLCRRPIGPLWIVALSLVVGIWSHIFWDSFTHAHGWFVAHSTILQFPILQFGTRTARVCHLLWYGSSFAGVGWIYISFEKWKQDSAAIRNAILLSILIVPISLIHHLLRNPVGIILTAALCGLTTLVFVFKSTGAQRPTENRINF